MTQQYEEFCVIREFSSCGVSLGEQAVPDASEGEGAKLTVNIGGVVTSPLRAPQAARDAAAAAERLCTPPPPPPK